MDPRPVTPVSFIFGLVVLGILNSQTHAELIYFRGGGGAQVPAVIDGDRVILKLADGEAAFLRGDFRAIVPGFNPSAEWPSRVEKARKEGSSTRYAAAWWGLENGLVAEAETEFRSLHRDNPNHAPSSRIVAALDRLKTPTTDPQNLDDFEKSLGVAMTRATGPHVILFHQHSQAEAQERIELLERIANAYSMVFAGQGIELQAPARRLVSAWFADRADYLAFLHSQNADAFKTTRGYFHPTWNAVVAYDDRSSDQQRAARRALEVSREEFNQSAAAIERIPGNGGRGRIRLGSESPRMMTSTEAKAKRERLEAEIRIAEIQLDFDRRAIDMGTATHEMIHQLAANTGLLPRHDSFPIWMHEGFAAQFEVIRGGRWAGISRAHDLRLADWRRIHPPPRLEPLIRDAGFGKGYQRDLYAQAWALVYFLRTQHPEKFLTFLDLLRSPKPERAPENEGASSAPIASPGARASTAFHRAFGDDLQSLEADWHQFLNSTQTPTERNDPGMKRNDSR